MQNNNLADNGNFMVSSTLNAVKFLLIYRHLQNIYWFKRGNCLSSVPRTEAFALPYPAEQTTLEPTPIWYTQIHMEYCMPILWIGTILHWLWYNHTRRHLPLLCSWQDKWKLRSFSSSWTKRQVNALNMSCLLPTPTTPLACGHFQNVPIARLGVCWDCVYALQHTVVPWLPHVHKAKLIQFC